MAKIVLISVNDINAEGLRILSASLIQNGHQPYIVFIQRNGFPYNRNKKYRYASRIIEEYDWTGINSKGQAYRLSRGPDLTITEEKLLLSLIQDIKPDIIGFTVTAPFVKRIVYLSCLIKSKYNMPIVWGGPGPTTDPKTCAAYCDYVCIGEGEKTIVDIASKIDNGEDIKEVNNLAHLQNGELVQNPLYSLIDNLDDLPIKDIYPENKFLIDDDCLVPDFNEINYSKGVKYHLMSSRGCLYSCSYCSENFVKRLYSPQKYLRRRSPSNVIKELEQAKKIVNYNVVQFEDEIFSLDYEWLEEFGDLYKERINKPFECYIYPNKDIERQLGLLKKMGLFYTCLALQSGSDRINREIFKRPFDKKLYLETAHILRKLNIGYYVDVITYNPFETIKDLQDTLSVLSQLPKPFPLCVNKLYVIKGTGIHALVENIKDRSVNKLVKDRTFSYYCRLFFLTTIFNKYIVYFIHKIRILEYFPFILTMFVPVLSIPSLSYRWYKRVSKVK